MSYQIGWHLCRGQAYGLWAWTNTTFLPLFSRWLKHFDMTEKHSVYMHHAPQLNVNCTETLKLPLQRWEMEYTLSEKTMKISFLVYQLISNLIGLSSLLLERPKHFYVFTLLATLRFWVLRPHTWAAKGTCRTRDPVVISVTTRDAIHTTSVQKNAIMVNMSVKLVQIWPSLY